LILPGNNVLGIDGKQALSAKLKRVPLAKRVYLDESGVNTSLQREFGRALRGEIVEGVKRGAKFERLNVIGALCFGTHFAIKCYKQTTNGAFFEKWFADKLLKAVPAGKGYTAIMDNAGFHRKKVLRKLARGKMRLLFLPPYSPDYNPIEKSWANMKRFLCDNLQNFNSLDNAIYSYFGVL
jgi:transposase